MGNEATLYTEQALLNYTADTTTSPPILQFGLRVWNGTSWVKSLNVASASTLANVNSSATNVTLLASNANRRGATIFNDSTQILYVKFGTTSSATSYTVQIASLGYYEFPAPIYTGQVDGIWASSNGAARTTELT